MSSQALDGSFRHRVRTIISIGCGRLNLVQAACYLAARDDNSIRLVCGWVPKRPRSLLVRLCSRIVGRDLSPGFAKRIVDRENVEVRQCTTAEFVLNGLFILCRMFSIPRYHMAVIGWKLFGFCSRRHLKGGEVFHVRSGAGQGGTIRTARRKGMRVLVDHSIAHPAFMGEALRDDYHRHNQVFWMGQDNPFWRLVLKDCEEADLLLVNSAFVKDTFIKAGYPEEKIRVVYKGVRRDFFGLKCHYRTDRCDKQKPLRLLFTGGFGIRKGAEYLLAALRILLARDMNVVLTVVGSYGGEAKSMLAENAVDPAYLKLVGHVPQDDLKSYLADADLYVFPSLAEGCASSGMEAMAAGLCVVTTVESGLPVCEGETGYLVPAKNALALADRIEWLAEHPQDVERAGRAASRLIQEQFTWEHYAQGVSAIYRELVSTSQDHDAGS